MLFRCFLDFMNKKTRKQLKKIWYFIWDDSIWSWIVNIILAFVLIKFVVYPGLGFLLNTSHPVVAVVSSSMEHRSVSSGKCLEFNEFELFGKSIRNCVKYQYTMCGNFYEERKFFALDDYWEECGKWYDSNPGINKNEFSALDVQCSKQKIKSHYNLYSFTNDSYFNPFYYYFTEIDSVAQAIITKSNLTVIKTDEDWYNSELVVDGIEYEFQEPVVFRFYSNQMDNRYYLSYFVDTLSLTFKRD